VIFVSGFVSALALLVCCGGENLAQAGLRLAAIEQGFALASRHWQFEAVPEHEAEQVAVLAEEPKRGAKRVAKR
jgi:hypothetical protein